MRLAVIPARGGSKRIPRKNIRDFCGKPMIAWSIQAAKHSGLFEHIIVSTDDQEIAATAEQFGGEVPFMRPTELADDLTATQPVIKHALHEAQARWGTIDYACCVYATAPFIRVRDLQAAYNQLVSSDADYAFSVTSYPYPIQRALKMTANGGVTMFHPEHLQSRSQDLEKSFHDAGQFYWGRARAWLMEEPLFSARAIPIILPRHLVQDIDDSEDWERAEWMFKAMNLEQVIG